jgi:hemerythrin-like domain-containing protein
MGIEGEAPMEATQILMDEHRVIERVLKAMHVASMRLSQGEQVRPAFFVNAALFMKNYADGCHHKKEEGILFVAMTESGIPLEGGPVAAMLAEHEQGRLFTRELRDSAQKWEAGDQSAQGAVVQNALGYVALLRQHIYKEDNILFPMADRRIPPVRQEQVAADFVRIQQEEMESGIQEKFRALAEILEKESTKRI